MSGIIIFKRIIILLIFPVVFGNGCSSLFFYPQKVLINNPHLEGVDYRDIFFKSSDGVKLHGWFLRSKKESKGTILLLHGNAENISTHVSNVIWLVENGFDVFIFDYRGYGKSEGRATIEGVHIDAASALELLANDMLENHPPIPPLEQRGGMVQAKRLIVFGQSLGGAIAVYTVANSPYKNSVDALIIDSAFSGYRLITREKLSDFIVTWPFQYPLSFLVKDYYSPVNWIRKVNPVPVLIIHGDKDTIVPVHHSSILFDKALHPKELWTIKDSGHIEAVRDKEVRVRLLNYSESMQ